MKVQIENRPEVASTENPRLSLQEMHVFAVRFAVKYRPVLEVLNDPLLQDNEFILYPTDLLCGNLHSSPLAYFGF